jgi:hypothetical protein
MINNEPDDFARKIVLEMVPHWETTAQFTTEKNPAIAARIADLYLNLLKELRKVEAELESRE